VQYAATAYTELLAGRGVAISMAAVGKPEENGFAEQLMRTDPRGINRYAITYYVF
jgi:transposase InsO family protein